MQQPASLPHIHSSSTRGNPTALSHQPSLLFVRVHFWPPLPSRVFRRSHHNTRSTVRSHRVHNEVVHPSPGSSRLSDHRRHRRCHAGCRVRCRPQRVVVLHTPSVGSACDFTTGDDARLTSPSPYILRWYEISIGGLPGGRVESSILTMSVPACRTWIGAPKCLLRALI